MVHLSSETKPWSFHYTGYPHWREAADPEFYYKVTYCIGVPPLSRVHHYTGYPHWREAVDPEFYCKVTHCVGYHCFTGYTTTQGMLLLMVPALEGAS